MVTANWRKNCPEMPDRKAEGTNTAHSVSAMETSAPPTSSIVRWAASFGFMPAAMLRSTFSTTTIASSTTMPTASTRPNSDRLFSDIPSASRMVKVPIKRNRDGDHRDERRAPGLQEQEHHADDEQDRDEDRGHDLIHRLRHEDRRIVDDDGRRRRAGSPSSGPASSSRTSCSTASEFAPGSAKISNGRPSLRSMKAVEP